MEQVDLTVEIQIGKRVNSYTLVKTEAPQEYDMLGAITIKDDIMLPSTGDTGERWTLIPTPHLDYHTGRYSSGLYDWEIIEHEDAVQWWVHDILWQRLQQEHRLNEVGA